MKPVAQMTNDEFYEFVIEHCMQGWIPIKRYLQLFPEETQNKIDTRVSRRIWKRGVEYSRPKGSTAWICLTAVREWVKKDSLTEEDDTIFESNPLD